MSNRESILKVAKSPEWVGRTIRRVGQKLVDADVSPGKAESHHRLFEFGKRMEQRGDIEDLRAAADWQGDLSPHKQRALARHRASRGSQWFLNYAPPGPGLRMNRIKPKTLEEAQLRLSHSLQHARSLQKKTAAVLSHAFVDEVREIMKVASEKPAPTDEELKETGRQRAVTSIAGETYRERSRRGERFGEMAGRVGGVVGGAAAGKKYVGGRLGTMGGAGLGYLTGGKAGKELGTELDIRKNAEAKEKKPPSKAGVIARSLGGMALGTGAGYGAAKGLEALAEKVRGKPRPIGRWWPAAAAGAGAGLGIAYPYLKARELKELQSAGERRND